jgi:hypothetical protein
MNSQQPPRLTSRPSLTRVSSQQSAQPGQIHVIVRLPYNRPRDAPPAPQQVSESLDGVVWQRSALIE